MRTANGGTAAVGRELCTRSTTKAEREGIIEREERLRKWRRSLPKRKPRPEQLPGPVTIIDARYLPVRGSTTPPRSGPGPTRPQQPTGQVSRNVTATHTAPAAPVAFGDVGLTARRRIHGSASSGVPCTSAGQHIAG